MTKIKMIFILLIVSMLISCSTKTITKNDEVETKEEISISNLAKDESFRKSLHLIQNNVTQTYSIVRGDGTIILNGMDSYNDILGLAKDVKTNEVNYIYKTVFGEGKEVISGEDAYSGETYTYSEPTIVTTYYDKDGNDIGLRTKSYSPNLVLGDKIVYSSLEEEYANRLFVFDAKTKNTEKAISNSVSFYAGHPIFSTYQYIDNNETDKAILVCDDEFNVIKTIENYSLSSVDKVDDVETAIVATTIILNKDKEAPDYVYGEDYVYKYNCLDKDFNLIFDEPVDARPNINEEYIATLHRGDVEFDFDFKNMKEVGENRKYSGFDNFNEEYLAKKRQYDPICEEIKNSKDKYTYVDAKIYKDKVLFFAHYDDKYDEINEVFIDPCDIYSLDKELLMSISNLNNAYEDDGYFLIDNCKLYDFDLNLIKEFDTELYVDKYDVGGKAFFEDSRNKDYTNREHFNIYDDKMNLLYENVKMAISYAYKDCLVLVFDDITIVIDKDNNIVKEFDRPLEIRNWYDEVDYKTFTDLNTNRMGILDSKDNIVVDGLKYISGLEKDCFTFTNGFKYGLMDYEGKVICDFSVFNTMNEDARPEDFKIRLID